MKKSDYNRLSGRRKTDIEVKVYSAYESVVWVLTL